MQTDTMQIQLQNKFDELSTRGAAIERDLRKPHSSDSAEQAQERENDEVLEALLRETKEELYLITKALKRIENGNYGECEACGEMIAEARLGAYPEADKCIDCAA